MIFVPNQKDQNGEDARELIRYHNTDIILDSATEKTI
jgi:hypothetical protein